MILFGKNQKLTLSQFYHILEDKIAVGISDESVKRLNDTRRFVDFILKSNIKVYGLSTGFADLRDKSINPAQAAELSYNLLKSHDAGIGSAFKDQIVLGAMIVQASSLAKGYSAFQVASLETLLGMINHRIILKVPSTGSLGASGDLAFLARVGRAMMGGEVPVSYKNSIMSARKALEIAGITPFNPQAKEGLAITNGTSFMVALLAIAYQKELKELENLLALQGLFYNAVHAVDAAFYIDMQKIRKQNGQELIAGMLRNHFKDSPLVDTGGVQDDYCIRCVPQILGAKIESILEQRKKIENELDAVTDNPLFFRGAEISEDISADRIIDFEGEKWAVLSGGNFHGEIITTIADIIVAANAKIALTLERQITYMLNPFKNKNRLPTYLITDEKKQGLTSGYMVTQYTANALVHKIQQLSQPTSCYNITSANESEDVVSYGASAAQRLLEQVEYLHELNTIYLGVAVQAYAITRQKYLNEYGTFSNEFLAEKIFLKSQEAMGEIYPIDYEEGFEKRYEMASALLNTGSLGRVSGIIL